MEDAHTSTVKGALAYFDVQPKKGLTASQIDANAETYGRNVLPEEDPVPLWKLILEQFKDQLVIILLLAAVVSFALAFFEEDSDGVAGKATAYVEPAVILLILILNATVGVVQETNAEKAIDALKEYSPDEAKVLRNGQVHKIHAADLVPGDIIQVAVGDKIPADCRLIEIFSSTFRVDQAILTGESYSVEKVLDAVKDKKAVKQDMLNIIFSGTAVTHGKAHAVVVQTGRSTAIGDIHESITSQIAQKTPLKQKLDDFGDQLAKVITFICIAVWVVNIRHFNDPSHHGWLKGAVYYFKIAVALAVAAIPEGLAVIITTCLALGTKKMAAKNAIVRSLPSVETLGATSVICSDKTGTLTTNQMSVTRLALVRTAKGATEEYRITGSSFAPEGDVIALKDDTIVDGTAAHEVLADVTRICSLCNESSIEYDAAKKRHVSLGEATEAALLVLVEKCQTEEDAFNATLPDLEEADRAMAVNTHIQGQYEKLVTLEFNRDRKSMSVLVKPAGKKKSSETMYVKGAPESVLERCTSVKTSEQGEVVKMTAECRRKILAEVKEWGTGESLRCIGLAMRDDPAPVAEMTLNDPSAFVQYEKELTWIGLVGMMDPPREEVADSIRQCREAGIRVIVITGDNQGTAEAICRNIGIFDEEEDDLTGRSFTGRQFDDMSEAEKQEAAKHASLFSRTEPMHKMQLVELLQQQGEIVAMTGDGVNDAPALKKADIGVAMGSGTDVAKLAADMVLQDDDFATIVAAVREGRAIYNNTKQFIRYLISSNIGEVVSIFLTVLLGMPEALIPVQLLWVNLVTDGLPATALGFNPPDHNIMKQRPRKASEPIVGKWLFVRYMIIGMYVGFATVFAYTWWFVFYADGPQITITQLCNFHVCNTQFPELGCDMFSNWMSQKATTMSLSVLVTIEMFNAMNSLSENESLLTLPIWTNGWLVFSIVLSMALHFMILYVPFFSSLFAIVPLNWPEWQAVLLISAPVILIDEVLKFVSRQSVEKRQRVKME